ncbi:MAG: hypothetical protein ABEI74_01810 [Candidatus Pacearchaeota archaeon]
MSSNSINWNAFEEIKNLENANNRINSLKKEIDLVIDNKNRQRLSKKALDLLEEILTSSGKNYPNKEDLWEDVYWLRYAFVELDEDHDEWPIIDDEVMEIFFDFQSDISYRKLLGKIGELKKRF